MSRPPDLRVGIDVGGTNTDAAVLDAAGGLVAWTKQPTTPDVTRGIVAALDAVLGEPGVDGSRITHAMLGTTHATNAVLQRRDLQRVALVRIGSPATHAIRPLFGWPEDLRAAVSAGEAIVPGGIEFDGRELVTFDPDAVSRFLGGLPEPPDGVALVSVFAPVSGRHEEAAAELVARELGPSVAVCRSGDVGTIGLLERENATVLNLALARLAQEVAGAFEAALQGHGLDAVAFFAQNDGTLMPLAQAVRLPVLTIGSGPANSLRGAAALTGLDTAIVADVGGTTTDIGVLVGGFPRESATGIDIGGVRTNFRMPDIVSIAVGGGTEVAASSNDGPRVGPGSVGFRLREAALVFGGATPTLTDAAVAAGRLVLGDAGATSATAGLLAAALAVADDRVAEGVDRVKTARGDQPVIAVGGGAALLPDDLAGASAVLRPPHAGVANAIGAAIAPVSGTVDRVVTIGAGERPAIIERLGDEARAAAVEAGAAPTTVEVVEVEEIPLAYLTTPASRFRVKAAGPMA
ncbi:MAG TPA: hydantoinase/oxoprolinase family protein [Actinomycetota bacterium]